MQTKYNTLQNNKTKTYTPCFFVITVSSEELIVSYQKYQMENSDFPATEIMQI